MRPRGGMLHRGDMTTTETSAPADLSGRSPLETVQVLYAAFGTGDMEGLLGAIHPEVDWSLQVDAPGAELVAMLRNGRGHDAVLHYFSGAALLEFHTFVPRRFLVDGDTVIVELELEVTHRTTGKRARLEEIHRFTVEQGLVVRYRPFVDTATLIELYRP